MICFFNHLYFKVSALQVSWAAYFFPLSAVYLNAGFQLDCVLNKKIKFCPVNEENMGNMYKLPACKFAKKTIRWNGV